MTEPNFLKADSPNQEPPAGYSRWRRDQDGVLWFRKDTLKLLRGVTEVDEPAEAQAAPQPTKKGFLRKIFGIPGWAR